MSRKGARFLLGVLVAAAILTLPVLLSQNELRNFARFFALVLAVLGVNVALGAGGIVSLGQSVFVGVGAFALVSFSDDFGLQFLRHCRWRRCSPVASASYSVFHRFAFETRSLPLCHLAMQ